MKLQINLLPYQLAIVKSKAKFLGFIGGTGTGKTFFLPVWLFIQVVSGAKEVIVSAPTVQMLKRNPVKYILNFLNSNQINYSFNKSDLVLQFLNSTVYFVSAENPERMQGIHADAVIGDEAGLFDRTWWDIAVQRVAYRKGKILLTTTPYGFNWLKTEVWDKWLSGNPDYFCVNPKSSDNPFYPIEEYERAKATLPEWKFKMLFEGQFTKPAGLIYPEYEIVKPFAIPDNWRVIRGVDFGYNNPFAVIWIAEDLNTGIFYIFKEFKKSSMDIEDIYRVLSQEPYIITYADPSSKETLEYLRKKGINIREAKKDVMAGILQVSAMFKSGKLKVFENCKLTIDELNMYQFETDKAGNVLDKPRKEHDHLMDALRYAIYTGVNTNYMPFMKAKINI